MENKKFAKAYVKLLKDNGMEIADKSVFVKAYMGNGANTLEQAEDMYDLVKYYESMKNK